MAQGIIVHQFRQANPDVVVMAEGFIVDILLLLISVDGDEVTSCLGALDLRIGPRAPATRRLWGAEQQLGRKGNTCPHKATLFAGQNNELTQQSCFLTAVITRALPNTR